MISILIPVYNVLITDFVERLLNQARALNTIFEILIIDDFSTIDFQKENSKLALLENVNYIQLNENIGRSRIRNLLAEKAKYENLIFTDCDMMPVNDNFIRNYIENLYENTVLCGGIKYSESDKISSDKILRLKYGIARESSSAEKRSLKPYSSFMTGNFCISKNDFRKISFDEKISGYGHEDTLFGYELSRQNINVKHIDNPLFHCGIENSTVFINKTLLAVKNLKYISENYNYPELENDIKLLRYRKKFINFGFIVRLTFIIFKALILINLKSKKPNLYLFDFYKLGYFFSLK